MAIFLTTPDNGTRRTPCLDPIIMIIGGGEYTFGDGYTWCGPYTGHTGQPTAIASTGSSQWIGVHNTIEARHARIELTEGSPPTQRSNAAWVQPLPTDPPTTGNDASMVVYDKTLGRFIVAHGGNNDCVTTDDYAESWTTQSTQVGIGNGGNSNVAVTEGGSTTIYHVFGGGGATTSNGGVSWSQNSFALPTNSAITLSYNPFTDELWLSLSNGTIYSNERSAFLSGSGGWTLELSTGVSTAQVDVNTRTGTAIVTWSTGGEWRSRRKPLGASSFEDTVVIATTSGSAGDVVYSPTINRIYAGCGDTLIRYSDDDGRSWQEDENLTLPGTTGGFRIQNKERFTTHDF